MDMNITAIIEKIEELYGTRIEAQALPEKGGTVPFAIIPDGQNLRSLKALLEEYREFPKRRTGTAVLNELESFLAHVARHKGPDSVIFAKRTEDQPSVTAIYDYNQAGETGEETARHLKHRATYAMPLTKAWQDWKGKDGVDMSQKDLAGFLEEQSMYLVSPPPLEGLAPESIVALATENGQRPYSHPLELRQVARKLRLTQNTDVVSSVDLDSGEVEIGFAQQNTRKADDTASAKVPSLFLLNLPIFEGGANWPLPVRLRHAVEDKKVKWTLSRFRPDLVFFAAFDAVREQIVAESGLPVFAGTPEQ